MSKYLFVLTISPVQSYITQARKTQDLFAGSYILSFLIDSIMRELEKKSKCEFIFPSKRTKAKPNRFIAKVETENIEAIGNNLKTFAVNEFVKIGKEIIDTVIEEEKVKTSFSELRDDIDLQLGTHLHVNWLAVPFDENNYKKAYKQLEVGLGSIKNIKEFMQLEEKGRKCTLCAERNILFYSRECKKYTTNKAKKLENATRKSMNHGEGLCSVCIMKKFAYKYKNVIFSSGYNRKFPSTVDIALSADIGKVDNNKIIEYKNMFFNNFDEELFYEDNVTKIYFEKNQYNEVKLDTAKKKLKEIVDEAKDNGAKFTKYYAIIMLDGDNMGKWLSGEYLESSDIKLTDFHVKLSEKLGDYAENIKEIISKSKGGVVYAGGDDVLAFMNLDNLFIIMSKLRATFPRFEEIADARGQTSSASCGVCIAHYKTPLKETLGWARKMEKEAKEVDGKDAFALSIQLRTGEIRKTVYKWKFDFMKNEQDGKKESKETIELMQNVVEKLSKGIFSATFINKLGEEFKLLIGSDGKYDNNKIVKVEIGRLVKRACTLTRNEKETKDTFEARKKKEIDDFVGVIESLHSTSGNMRNFLACLDILDFVERQVSKYDDTN